MTKLVCQEGGEIINKALERDRNVASALEPKENRRERVEKQGFSLGVLKEKEKSGGTGDTAKTPTRRLPWLLRLISPRLQALQCITRRLTGSRKIRQKADLHTFRARPAEETSKRAHSAVEELDWVWRSC